MIIINEQNGLSRNDGRFWWSVELEAEPSLTPAAAEELLLTVADLSGSIGSELTEDGGRTVLKAAYRSSEDVEHWLAVLQGLAVQFKGFHVRAHGRVEDRPWQQEFMEAFPPLAVGKKLAVMAPWHRGKEPAGRLPLYIYPSSAFGTGYHESTQIALSLLEETVKGGELILDVGTGTGVLFIAALKLGADKAVARDLDPVVVSEVERNMALNDIAPERCDLAVGDLVKGVSLRADILTANILLAPNMQLLNDVLRVLTPGGTAIFAGMTVPERPVFLAALAAAGLAPVRELIIGDWWGAAARQK